MTSLDGLRGVAAMMVLVHHSAFQAGSYKLLESGYLAVDLFFMLSGFVVAAAYEKRLADGLAVSAFFGMRLKRLYPVMALGIVAGAGIALASGQRGSAVLIRLPAQLLFVPIFAGTLGVFPLNGVQWSLFFELFANGVHALVLRRWSVRALQWTAGAALLVLLVAAQRNASFVVGDRGSNFLGGFPRVLFSYGVGVIFFRLRQHVSWRSPGASAGLVYACLLFAIAMADVAKMSVAAWIVDSVVVALVLPAILFAAIDAPIGEEMAGVAQTIGSMSYPLYAVHLPIIGLVRLVSTAPGAGPFAMAVSLALIAAFAVARVMEPKRAERAHVGRAAAVPA